MRRTCACHPPSLFQSNQSTDQRHANRFTSFSSVDLKRVNSRRSVASDPPRSATCLVSYVGVIAMSWRRNGRTSEKGPRVYMYLSCVSIVCKLTNLSFYAYIIYLLCYGTRLSPF